MRSCDLSADPQRKFREVQALFRLPSIALVEKDLHVVRAIAALTAIDARSGRVGGQEHLLARRNATAES